MSFKTIAIVTSIVSLLLGMGYIFFGTLVIGRWQIEPTESVLLLGRRIGVLYLGLAVIFFPARSIPASSARTSLAAGAAVVCSFLAILGIYELSAGRVGTGIIASITLESLLALGYIRILVSDHKLAVGDRTQPAGHISHPG